MTAKQQISKIFIPLIMGPILLMLLFIQLNQPSEDASRLHRELQLLTEANAPLPGCGGCCIPEEEGGDETDEDPDGTHPNNYPGIQNRLLFTHIPAFLNYRRPFLSFYAWLYLFLAVFRI